MSTLKKRRTTKHADQPAVAVYTTPTCQGCPKTLRTLRDHNIPHTVVDLTQDKNAYTYVTQDLGYRQAPIVVVYHRWELASWSGHNPDLIAEFILQHYPTNTSRFDDDVFDEVATLGEYPSIDMDSPGTPVTSGYTTGRSTGPHLRFHGETGPELKDYRGGETA